jgi:hypothetical protein
MSHSATQSRQPGTRAALPRRGSRLALGWLGAWALACAAVLAHAAWAQWAAATRPNVAAAVVQALALTDLVWFTEARYTRHLSQADLHSAFQDGPMAMDPFPTGSLLAPVRSFPPAGFSDTAPRP